MNRADGRLRTVSYRMRNAGVPEETIRDLAASWLDYSEAERQRIAARSTIQWADTLATFDADASVFPASTAEVIDNLTVDAAPDYPPAAVDLADVVESITVNGEDVGAPEVGTRPDDAHPGLTVAGAFTLDDIPTDIRDLRLWVGDDPARARAALDADRVRRDGKARTTVTRLAREVAGPDV